MEILGILVVAVLLWICSALGESSAPIKPRPRDIITGKAYVLDGDTIRVAGTKIRLEGIDAPELDQVAKHQHGYWFKQGQWVKSALIKAIGGKEVQVKVKKYDKYDRVIGIVTCPT